MSPIVVEIRERKNIKEMNKLIRFHVPKLRRTFPGRRSIALARYWHTSKKMSSESSDVKWNDGLTPLQLMVLKDKATERPNTGAYLHTKDTGVYHCANCDTPLYSSNAKFDARCGWPAFYEEVSPGAITYHRDESMMPARVEICCGKCGGHLGHVFEGEGWKQLLNLPKDSRHCVNSASLNFKKE